MNETKVSNGTDGKHLEVLIKKFSSNFAYCVLSLLC